MAEPSSPPWQHHRLGWIGLGNMGLAMATNLQKHLLKLESNPLRYHNRTMARGQGLEDLGALPSESVGGLVQNCDIIFISLSDDNALESIAAQILSSRTPLTSMVFVDTSTVAPATTAAIAAKFHTEGASFVAAPAFGATPVAVQGRLLFGIAGPAAAVSVVKSILESCLARAVLVVGESPAQASLLKTTGNFITAALAETISEAHVLAEKAGLPVDALDQLINENYGPYAHNISRKLVEGVYAPAKGDRPRSDLTLAVKDVQHGIDVGREVGAPLKVAELTMEHLLEAKKWADQEGRALDSSAVYGVVRVDAGLDFANSAVKARDLNLEN